MKYILLIVVFFLSISSCRTTYPYPDGYYYEGGIWYYYYRGHRQAYHYYDGTNYRHHPYSSPFRGGGSRGGRGHRH
jgi:hypothetical protein